MDSIEIRNIDGRVVARSRNLRGILTYSRTNVVERVDLFGPNNQGGGTLGVTWINGSTCLADFASFQVMRQWANARRAFKGAHTPGPWHMKDTSDASCQWGAVYAGGNCICAGMNQNDARLIAAAPELLEALTLAHEALGQLTGYQQGTTATTIRAALAKVRS